MLDDMGWLRLVGSLKLQVSFAEYRLFYRALLQKRPIILKSLLIVATPYSYDDVVSLYHYVTSGDGTTASYGVATISRFLKMIGLFFRI